jgi:putative FmdB family regulatory protein
MPLYEYVCDACGHRFEIIQKFSDAAPEACPSCGKGPVVRQFSSPAIQFKGSGFYITDYAQKGQADRKAGESSGGTRSEGTKTDAAKTDTAKTDTAKSEAPAKTETATKSDTAAPKSEKT